MKPFSIIPELRIGTIIEVAGTSIRIELDGKITELTRTYNGRVYPIGQFASVIKIHFGRQILLAYVKLLRMRSEIDREEGRMPLSASDDSRVIDADLFGEGLWNETKRSFIFRRGVRNYPLPGQSVYLTTQKELQKVYQGAETKQRGARSPMIPLGNYVGAEATLCYANLDKLFNMHCAVLGSTGAGKSGTVAALIHSVLDHKPNKNGNETLRPRIILIDPHGEYTGAFGKKCTVYRAYNLLAGETKYPTKLLRLPYWLMTGEEIRDLIIGKTEWEATSENNIVYKALSHSRLHQRGWIEATKKWVGEKADTNIDPAEPRPTEHHYQSKIVEYDRDTPDPFSLDEFLSHIKEEQGVRIKSGKWDPMSPSDFKSHSSVINKLGVLRTDPRLSFMMSNYAEGDPDLPEILEQFIGNVDTKDQKNVDIRIIDISGLPNEIAGPLTAAIARLLFQYKVWQTREERERDPLLIICEEAHRYVPDTGLAEYQSAQKAIRRIAKEGRKYGIGLLLVSQRPADVERTVLSQCNSWIVMRLTNSADQEHVNRFLPDSLAGLSRLLPSLSRQEAIFVGEAAAVPARIVVRDLPKEQLPESDDISFIEGWVKPPIERDSIEAVVKRWRRE
jgi:Helicase HerA, central domain